MKRATIQTRIAARFFEVHPLLVFFTPVYSTHRLGVDAGRGRTISRDYRKY